MVERLIRVITEPVEQLMKRILNQYNRKPRGWKVLADFKGNVLVLGPGGGYSLKFVSINPNEYTGVGVRIKSLNELRRLVEAVPSFGFRPLSSMEVRELLDTIHRGGAIDSRLIDKLLEAKPIPIQELQEKRPKAVLNGPVIAHPNLSTISRSQRELEKKLTLEAYKLFRRKYPKRASIYV